MLAASTLQLHRHADAAERAGGVPLPKPVQGLMRLAAKVMTTVAHRI